MRELREESGYVGRTARLLGSIHPNPAMQSNRCHLVLVEEAQRSAERARAAQLAGARQMDAYIASLRASADVEIHAGNFEKKP